MFKLKTTPNIKVTIIINLINSIKDTTVIQFFMEKNVCEGKQ